MNYYDYLFLFFYSIIFLCPLLSVFVSLSLPPSLPPSLRPSLPLSLSLSPSLSHLPYSSSELQVDHYTAPAAHMELGLLHLEKGSLQEAEKTLETAKYAPYQTHTHITLVSSLVSISAVVRQIGIFSPAILYRLPYCNRFKQELVVYNVLSYKLCGSFYVFAPPLYTLSLSSWHLLSPDCLLFWDADFNRRA